LEKNIRKHLGKMTSILNEGKNSNLSDFGTVDTVINCDSVVAAMLAFIFIYISKYGDDFKREQLNSVFEDKADMSLCIISLLQDTIIKLDKNQGVAILHVLDHEGQYRLYCRVLGSSIESESRKRTGGSGHLILGFPVIVTNAKNIDNLQFNDQNEEETINKDLSFVQYNNKPPRLIETYRGEDDNLHVKFVDLSL